MISSRATLYKGIRFRSRLEARWAAFFDLAGWPWVYEPSDEPQWVPDFRLLGNGESIPVEVKPINWSASHVSMRDDATQRKDLKKVFAYKGEEVLILGSYPVIDNDGRDWAMSALGVLFREGGYADMHESWPRLDIAILWTGTDRALDFCAYDGSFRYRMSGEYDGDHHLKSLSADRLRMIWGAASNVTQWRGK